jgi:pimeloyl-ACP methyl ester carboxylesterase
MTERERELAVYRTDRSADGPQVVLVHGTMDRAAGMLRVARGLRHLDVVRYDRRGYGRSSGAARARSFDDHVDDLVSVVGCRPTVVFGHSYGGVIALALASGSGGRVPPANLLGVVTYEAPMAWQPWWPAPPSAEAVPSVAAERFISSMLGDDVWNRLPESSRAARRAEGATMLDELRWQSDQRYELAALQVQVLTAVGSDSSPVAHRAASETRRLLGPAAVRTIADADHFAPLYRANAVAALIDEMVQQVWPTP